MCLGIPGKVTETYSVDELPMGKVEFGGIIKEVCLAYTPDVEVGEYVLVHVGFALDKIDEAEANATLCCFEEITEALAADPQVVS